MKRLIEEEEELKSQPNKVNFCLQTHYAWIVSALSVISLASVIVAVTLSAVLVRNSSSSSNSKAPKNVIFMVADGFGPASQTFARVATKKVLPLDNILVGTSRTYSSDSSVTDSAAGATAFSCAKKSYNNAVAVTPDGRACGTLVEAAILKGMRTGIVVTTNITDATPAAFSAHAAHRAMQSMIAMQQIIDIAKLNKKNKWGIDLMFGGGKCFFLPNTDPNSCRNDTNDIYSIAKNVYGYNTVGTKQEMDNLKQLPVLGFFSNVELRYNIDRLPDDPQPTLAEMTAKALSLLQANSKDSGFFLLVEGSRIDHAGHSNDIAAQLREVQAYNEAIKVALDFAKIYGNTLVVSTADHETGGVTLGRCVDKECLYSYNADFVNGITASTEKIASEIMRQGATNVAVVMNSFGIPSLTPFEEDIIFRTNRTSSTQKNIMLGVDEVINRRAYIGFSTLGHTGVDVNVYAYGAEERIFRGNQENTDIGAKLAKLLRLDLEAITNLLNQ